jgi:aryl-alcohol dehydrogenase-like predicted oxidoreductase
MANEAERNGFMPRRQLGRTGFVATVLGIGDVADRAVALDVCVATIRRAIDAGLNVIDTAPSYEDGYSEQIVGAAVKGCRERLFVIDKIDHLDQPVEPQVVASLRRLDLEYTDLFVFHGVSKPADWQRLAAPGGGMEQLAACVRAGRTRFRGVSSHHPDVLRAAIDSGLCDVVMFSVGPFVDERYVKEMVPLARQRGVGTVCFKTFGAGKLLCDTPGYNQPLANRPRGKFSSGGAAGQGPLLPHLTVEQCVSYTLTVDPDVALLGMSFPNEQEAAFEAARRFWPLTEQQLAEILALAAAAVRGKGDCWWNPPSE